MPFLSEAHIEQIKILRNEGKKPRDIVEIMEKTYPGASFNIAQIYAVKTEKIAKPHNQIKRSYKKRKPESNTQSDKELAEITSLLKDIKEGYKLIFAYLRTQLIASRAEVYAMLTGAGIDIPE